MYKLIDVLPLLEAAEDTGKAAMLGATAKDQRGATVIAQICAALEEDAAVHFYTDGAWSMYELLMSLTGITGPCKALIATYAMSETSARVLAQLKEQGMITALQCLIDNRTDTRSAGSLQLLQSVSDRCVMAACHAKLTILQGRDKSIVITGSANYTENKRLECGFVTTDSEAVKFHHGWITKALNDGE